jgi:hypothetical protein
MHAHTHAKHHTSYAPTHLLQRAVVRLEERPEAAALAGVDDPRVDGAQQGGGPRAQGLDLDGVGCGWLRLVAVGCGWLRLVAVEILRFLGRPGEINCG